MNIKLNAQQKKATKEEIPIVEVSIKFNTRRKAYISIQIVKVLLQNYEIPKKRLML